MNYNDYNNNDYNNDYYNDLELCYFDPGAWIKLHNNNNNNNNNKFTKVIDPIRRPKQIIKAITTSIGTWKDKLKLLFLFYNIQTKSIHDLFHNDYLNNNEQQEEDIDTMTCLQSKYKFSDKIMNEFFIPFLEGIYLCTLKEQSSKMFYFIMKMFINGYATLPKYGMQSISNQLVDMCLELDVDLRLNHVVTNIESKVFGGGEEEEEEEEGGGFIIQYDCNDNGKNMQNIIHAKKVICATDYKNACTLLSTLDGIDFNVDDIIKKQPQRSVGCLYFSFRGDAPIMEPMLILNSRVNGQAIGPINTVSFPSVVSESYAPKGYHLCSVTLTERTLNMYNGKDDDLVQDVRVQLADWFEDYSEDILYTWEQKGEVFKILNAQPSQFGCDFPANVNGGRDCTTFRGMTLPHGLLVCGDYMVRKTHCLYYYYYYHHHYYFILRILSNHHIKEYSKSQWCN